jgi:alpha-mannosidase
MSFCRSQPANASLLTLKRAEDGDGIVVRLIETEGRSATANIALPHLTVRGAWAANLAEENQSELAFSPHQVTTPIKAFGLATVRIRVQPTR